MILYHTYCPVHLQKRLTIKKTDFVKVKSADGKTKETPIFYCDKCNCYYLYTEKKAFHLTKSAKLYHNLPVYYANVKYTLIKEGETTTLASQMMKSTILKKNSVPGSGSGKSLVKAPKKPNSTQVKTGPALSKSVQNTAYKESDMFVRIHILTKAEMEGKLATNYSNIQKAFPGATTDKMDINQFIRKVFPAGIAQKVVIRNESFIGSNGYIIRSAEIYSISSSYQKKYLPADTYISFGGRISNGEFIIQELRIWEHPVLKAGDIEADIIFLYDGPNHTNWLYNVTYNTAESSEKLVGELADWNSYLEWKRQLAELRIKGVKYIGFKIDTEEREMTFLAVTDGKDSFDEFRKYLRRNEVSIFSNNYSNNRWNFEFNREYQDNANNDSGVALTFVRFGDSYGIDDINAYDWDLIRDDAKKYDGEIDALRTSFMLQGIANYTAPYCIELVFEFSSNASNIVDRQLRRYGELQSDIEETIADEFYGDGYIATSQIGDFALLRRLKNAVNDLANGKSASHGLDQWLFDIKKARVPSQIIGITEWQNEDINRKQKDAVEKILSVPDVCLIQGPPGTGKTTVIAEAIYQLVNRNKRVLVASQANLAVDNALERLISNPKIRAIRLGSAKKIDASVSNITEGNVLESFYGSIVEYIDKQYLRKWNKADAVREGGDYDLKRYHTAEAAIMDTQIQIAEKQAEISRIESEIDSSSGYSRLNELKTQKINLKMLRAFCKGVDDELELMLSKDALIELWDVIEQTVLSVSNQGLYLTKTGIDSNDLDDPKRLNVANDILSSVLLNGKAAVKLLEKLSRNQQFGGSSKEIEELKIQEQKLLARMASETTPENIAEWKAVNAKLNELTASGAGLSKKEELLFDASKLQELDEEGTRSYIVTVLSTSLPLIQDMILKADNTAVSLLEKIDEEEAAFDNALEVKERTKTSLGEEIAALEISEKEQERLRSAILRKYKASPATLEQSIANYVASYQKNIQTSIDRNDWEVIFRGLKDWVEEIPDYMQEKDIYLKDYINGCNVVGVSCTENARTLLENGFDDFDVVIIDEVSKATPPELLIPMLRGRKIILVGDHRQLPPLFNEHEKTYQEVAEQQEGMEDIVVPLTMEDFNKYKDMVTASLFERYFENADSKIKETLQYQYRMHTDIMDIINVFYDNQLLDGNEDNYTYDTKAHYLNIRSTAGTEMIIPDRHAYWFDSSELQGVRIFEQRKQGSTSAENIVEAEMILELLRKMEIQYANMANVTTPVSVGVISFYYDQVALIRKMLREETFHAINVEVNTVDRFQGKEKEVIFVSLVRNVKKSAHNVDSHIAAFQRINVAFSRAQNLLIIVGAKDMYAEQPVKMTDMNDGTEKVVMVYKNIIEMMDQRGTYFTGDEVIPDIRAMEILDNLKTNGGNES